MSDTYTAATQTEGAEAPPRGAFAETLDGMSEENLRKLMEEIIDRLPVEDLDGVIHAAQEKRRSKQDEAREAFLRSIRDQAASLGLRVNVTPMNAPMPSSGGRRTRRDAGAPVAPKFRGPNGEEWSGRGRPPKWLAALEAEGQQRDQYRIA